MRWQVSSKGPVGDFAVALTAKQTTGSEHLIGSAR